MELIVLYAKKAKIVADSLVRASTVLEAHALAY